MHPTQEQIPTSMHLDQRESGQIREWLLHSNGVLRDDRIRNAVIENHRRTTAAITATTSAVKAATARFRHNTNQDYSGLVSSIKGNRERSAKLTASTEIISDNTEAISRARAQYSKLYRADQWQSQEMSQITANNEEVLERISTVQHSVSLQVTKAQQNLLETSEILKKYRPDEGAETRDRRTST